MRPIWLWAHPRSRSTALERMMIERGDVTVWHEPLVTLVDDGGWEGLRSAAAILAAARAHPARIFGKDTTEYFYALSADAAAGVTHTFVVREPAAAIASHVRIKADASCSDIGYENQWRMYEQLRSYGHEPVVVDADQLVSNPAGVIGAYCAAVGLPYRPDALRWEAGHRPEWERTRRWHLDAGTSTGFTPATRPPPELTGHLRDYLTHHRPYYDRLIEHALRIEEEP